MTSDQYILKNCNEQLTNRIKELNEKERIYSWSHRAIPPAKYIANENNCVDIVTSNVNESKDYLIAQVQFFMNSDGYADENTVQVYLEPEPILYSEFKEKNIPLYEHVPDVDRSEKVMDYSKNLDKLTDMFDISSGIFALQTQNSLNSVDLQVNRRNSVQNSTPTSTSTVGTNRNYSRDGVRNQNPSIKPTLWSSRQRPQSPNTMQTTMDLDSPNAVASPIEGPVISVDGFDAYIKGNPDWMPKFVYLYKSKGYEQFNKIIAVMKDAYKNFKAKYPNVGILKFFDLFCINVDKQGKLRYTCQKMPAAEMYALENGLCSMCDSCTYANSCHGSNTGRPKYLSAVLMD